MSDLGKLWVQIVPSAQGFGDELSGILVPAADAAGEEGGASFISSMAKGLAGGALALTGALVGATTAAVKGAQEFAAYGDNIDKMSQKMGLSATAYQEWDAVMQHSGTSIETMKSSMKTLANAAESGNDAFERIGLTLEDVQSMSQEDLFSATISGLQNVEDTTERTYLAGQLLGRGATELGALLNTSAEETQAMKDRVHELGGVLSDDSVKAAAAFQDNLQDMQTAMDGLKRGIEANFLPGLNEIMAGITGLIAGDEGASAQLGAGIENLLTTVINSIPEMAETAMSLVTAFLDAFIEIAPGLAETGFNMLTELIAGIWSNLPSLIETAFSLINDFAGYILQNLPTLMQKGAEMAENVASGIASNIPSIISAIAGGLAQLLATIASNLPGILQKGIELIGQLAAGIISAIPKAVATVPQIFADIKSKFTSLDWANIGTQVINGIANGIKNGASKVVDAAKNLAKSAFDAAKNFLGIASPSKMFRYLGDMSVEGYRLEIEDGTEPIRKSVSAMMGDAVGAGTEAVTSTLRRSSNAYSAYAPAAETTENRVYTIDVPLYADGRQIARATATFTQAELDRNQRNMNRRVGIA